MTPRPDHADTLEPWDAETQDDLAVDRASHAVAAVVLFVGSITAAGLCGLLVGFIAGSM
jgi:hypothetical protein